MTSFVSRDSCTVTWQLLCHMLLVGLCDTILSCDPSILVTWHYTSDIYTDSLKPLQRLSSVYMWILLLCTLYMLLLCTYYAVWIRLTYRLMYVLRPSQKNKHFYTTTTFTLFYLLHYYYFCTSFIFYTTTAFTLPLLYLFTLFLHSAYLLSWYTRFSALQRIAYRHTNTVTITLLLLSYYKHNVPL